MDPAPAATSQKWLRLAKVNSASQIFFVDCWLRFSYLCIFHFSPQHVGFALQCIHCPYSLFPHVQTIIMILQTFNRLSVIKMKLANGLRSAGTWIASGVADLHPRGKSF